MSYPEFNGATDAQGVKPGSLVKRITSEGISYTLTLNGTRSGIEAYAIARGDELYVTEPLWGVPADYYVDELSERVILNGTTSDEDSLEVDIVCRQPVNMSDGILISSIPDVFELTWQQMDQALFAHTTRYTTLKQFVGSTNKTVWGFIQEWINAATAADQEAVFKVIQADGTADQQIDFEDYCVMVTRGVESREIFLPVLTRTQVTNTTPTSTATPGQIETPPAGFGTMTPSGFSWRRMPDVVSRTGRSGAYNLRSQWVGDLAWDPRLYGTLAQQAGGTGGEYQSLG